MKEYSVGITTYHLRFNDWLKPLITSIKKQRPNIEIILSINGQHNSQFIEDYRKEILAFCAEYNNIFPIFYPKFRSLVRMWNMNLQFASNDTVLLLEDDIYIYDGFFDKYETLDIDKIFTLNGGYAAISCNRKIVNELNWFDERFLGLGHEDGNFNIKYEKHFGRAMPNIYIDSLNCEAIIIKDEARLAGQRRTEEHDGRYNVFNKEVAEYINNNLYEKINYPYESYYWENKHKL